MEKIVYKPYHNEELERGDQIKMWFAPDAKIVVADVLYKVRDGVWMVWIANNTIRGEYMADKPAVRGVSKQIHESVKYSEETMKMQKMIYPYYEAIV